MVKQVFTYLFTVLFLFTREIKSQLRFKYQFPFPRSQRFQVWFPFALMDFKTF